MATERLSSSRVGRNARLLRNGFSILGLLAFGFVVLNKRTALARSFTRIGHPRWSWVALGIVLEALSMMTFAMMQSRLLRVGGKRVGTGPMIATTLAANSLSGSVPVAGPELGAALTFRRFKEQGADASLAGWTLVVGGFVSWLGAVVVLGAGAFLSENFAVVGVTLVAGVLAGVLALLFWFGLGHARVRKVLTVVASWVLRPVCRLRSKPVPDPVAAVSGWIASLRSLRPTKGEWRVIGGLGLGNWLTDAGVLALSIVALGGNVPWRSILLVYGLGTLVGSLRLTPGGLGLVEGTLCVGLVSAGIPAALALGAVLLYRLVSLWLLLFVGWGVLLWLRLKHLPHRTAMAGRVA